MKEKDLSRFGRAFAACSVLGRLMTHRDLAVLGPWGRSSLVADVLVLYWPANDVCQYGDECQLLTYQCCMLTIGLPVTSVSMVTVWSCWYTVLYVDHNYAALVWSTYSHVSVWWRLGVAGVQFSLVSMRSENPLCAAPQISPTLLWKLFQCSSDSRWYCLVLLRKIFESFLLISTPLSCKRSCCAVC